MKNKSRILLACGIICGILLTGCGQKGALFIPGSENEAAEYNAKKNEFKKRRNKRKQASE